MGQHCFVGSGVRGALPPTVVKIYVIVVVFWEWIRKDGKIAECYTFYAW